MNEAIVMYKGVSFDRVKKVEGIVWRICIDIYLLYAWEIVQQRYLKWRRSSKTDKKWTVDLIYKLCEIQRGYWQYRNFVLHNTPLAEVIVRLSPLDRSLGT